MRPEYPILYRGEEARRICAEALANIDSFELKDKDSNNARKILSEAGIDAVAIYAPGGFPRVLKINHEEYAFVKVRTEKESFWAKLFADRRLIADNDLFDGTIKAGDELALASSGDLIPLVEKRDGFRIR